MVNPRKLPWLAGTSTTWRCISYWTWDFPLPCYFSGGYMKIFWKHQDLSKHSLWGTPHKESLMKQIQRVCNGVMQIPRMFIDWIFKTTHPAIGLNIHTFPHIRKRPSWGFFGGPQQKGQPPAFCYTAGTKAESSQRQGIMATTSRGSTFQVAETWWNRWMSWKV